MLILSEVLLLCCAIPIQHAYFVLFSSIPRFEILMFASAIEHHLISCFSWHTTCICIYVCLLCNRQTEPPLLPIIQRQSITIINEIFISRANQIIIKNVMYVEKERLKLNENNRSSSLSRSLWQWRMFFQFRFSCLKNRITTMLITGPTPCIPQPQNAVF